MNMEARYFEGLEYLDTISIQYKEILSNVTTRGQRKLDDIELMDVRFGRSTFNHFESFHSYFGLSRNMIHHLFQKIPYHRVVWTVMMEDLHQSFHSNSFNTFDYC